MIIEPGSMLATHYRVERVIGEGGMGIVVEAVHEITERRVAIKRLLPHVAAHREAAARLLNEARAACRSRHPNVIEIHDVVRDGDATLLVMELLHGESLRDALERGKLPTRELVERLIPAMRGVAEAHRQGVIHRDIHPANIFFARDAQGGVVTKVLDFGICKLVQTDSGRGNLTRDGTTMGIPMYMSYEQLTNAGGVDGRSDVYSFGVVLYEALSGRAPYAGNSYAEIAVAMINQRLTPLLAHRPDVPEPLARIVERAIAHEPDRRTAGLDALADELTAFLAQEQSDAGAMASDARPPERERPTLPVRRALTVRSRRSWLALILACAALGLVVALALRLRHGTRGAQRVQPASRPAQQHPNEPARERAIERLPIIPADHAGPSDELPSGRDPSDPPEPAANEPTPFVRRKQLAPPKTRPVSTLPADSREEREGTTEPLDRRRHRATKRPLNPKDFR